MVGVVGGVAKTVQGYGRYGLIWNLGVLVPLSSAWGFIGVFGVFNLFFALSQTSAVVGAAL